MKLELIEDYRTYEGLAPAWERLWERCPSATPFQSPAWQLPWWRRFGTGKLKVVALFDEAGGGLAGLWPAQIVSDDPGRDDPVRTLLMNGTGVSDYLDILIPPAAAREGAARVFQWLDDCGRDWDRCDLQEIRAGSPLLEAAFPQGMGVRVEALEVCPGVALPGSYEVYLSGLPANHRRSLRRAGRLIEKRGGISIEEVEAGTVREFLDALFDLHGERWGRRDQPGVLRDEAVRAFHHEVAEAMFRKRRLRLYRMRREGRTLSVLYLFKAGSGTFCYLGGFDPSEEQLSPGAVLMGHAIAEAIAEGQKEFDFLRGNEPYKYLWGCRDRQNYRILIEKKS